MKIIVGYTLYIFTCPITLKFYGATHVSPTKTKSYQQIPEKTKHNGEHEKRAKQY